MLSAHRQSQSGSPRLRASPVLGRSGNPLPHPLLPFLPCCWAGHGAGCAGVSALCGNSSGSKTQKGVRVDSWAPCYGIICDTLVFLLPFILPSVKQAFSLFLPDFLPCIPTATLFSCRGGLATRAHWCKEIWLLPCPALHIFPWWDVVLAAPP